MGGTQATNGPSKFEASKKFNTNRSNDDGIISSFATTPTARAGSNHMLETPTSTKQPPNMSDDMLRQDTYSSTPTAKPKANRFGGAVQSRPTAPKMALAKPSSPKVPNPGNLYKSNVPKYDLGKVLAKKDPARKPAPKPKSMNNFVKNVVEILGGQASSKTPLTKQHAQKLTEKRYNLPSHATHQEKKDIYDVEAKAFDLMYPPASNRPTQGQEKGKSAPKLVDLYKAIGAIPDHEQKQEIADRQRFNNVTADDGNPYNKYAGQQYAQADIGIVSDAYPSNAKKALAQAGKVIADMVGVEPTDQTKFDLKEIEQKIEKAPNRWGINRNVEGVNNPEVQEILKRMDDIRNLNVDEKADLLRDIYKLDDNNQELSSITGTLQNKFYDVQDNTFKYSHMMTDAELRGHLELSENVADYAKFVEENIGSIGDMIDSADKLSGKGDKGKILTALAPKPAEVMFTLIDLTSGGIFNHYTDREKKYIAEMIKRGLINDDHPK